MNEKQNREREKREEKRREEIELNNCLWPSLPNELFDEKYKTC
jgi:hypothetical protein